MKRFISTKMIVTNCAIMLIIAFVYIAAFMPFGEPIRSDAPRLKGSTGGSNIALQITVDERSDVGAYMDMLDSFGAAGTFFFSAQRIGENADIISNIRARGHGIGYYTDGQPSVMYIGGGYSLPVMSYEMGTENARVCPSIDVSKLQKRNDWAQVLQDSLCNDLFLYVDADIDLAEFEKIVQIVSDKGYTILKIDEML